MEKQWKMPVFEKGEKKQRVFFTKLVYVYIDVDPVLLYTTYVHIYICTYIMKSQI